MLSASVCIQNASPIMSMVIQRTNMAGIPETGCCMYTITILSNLMRDIGRQ